MRISEKKLKNLVREQVRNKLAQIVPAGKIVDGEELFGYVRMGVKTMGINTNIFADDGRTFEMFKHPIYTVFQNGNEFIPIEIETENLKYNIEEKDLKISKDVFNDVVDFIKLNRETLIKLVREEIGHEQLDKMFIFNKKPTAN